MDVNYEDIYVNNTSQAVKNSLIGLCTLNSNLELLDIGNVVLTKGLNSSDKVLIVSGGASGFEPAYAQYVGTGMLSAAIQGDILLSPPCKPILKTLRELAYISIKGILLIVPGNSGELLNFGLAVERSKKERLPVMMIPVLDYVDNPTLPPMKQRGLSGIVLVIKIAGAMAEEGTKTLQQIYDFCINVTENMISTSCLTKTNQGQCLCKQKDTYDIGSMLNGEVSTKKLKDSNLQEVCIYLLNELLNNKKIDKSEERKPLVLLLNNVGGLSKMEEMMVIKDLIDKIDQKSFTLKRVYSGNFISSQCFHGFTITILRVFDDNVIKYLDYPTDASAWQQVLETRDDIKLPTVIPSMLRKKSASRVIPVVGPKLSEKSAHMIKTAAEFACEALISCEKRINMMDSETSNGKVGTQMKLASILFLQKYRSNKIPFDHPYHFFHYLSKISEYQVGGSVGAILCILLEAMSNTFAPLEELDVYLEAPMWLEALKNAVYAIKKYTLARSGDNTILDPLEACIKGTVDNLFTSETYLDAFGCGVSAAESITKELKKKDCLYPDAGAHAIVIILRSSYEALKSL